jgi:hypothetical protein
LSKSATVTVTDASGRRHSVDVCAASTHDAAHLFITHAKGDPQTAIPPLTLGTVFEVVTDGKVHKGAGRALQRWILKERQERKGPAGMLFSQRPGLEEAGRNQPSNRVWNSRAGYFDRRCIRQRIQS